MGEWNAMTYEGKGTILRVVREQAHAFFAMVESPEAWTRETTSCPRWTTADVVGHIVDTTEGYFAAFDAARSHTTAEGHALAEMSRLAGDRAIAFRDESQQVMLERLRTDFDKVMELLDGVSADDWTGLIVSHPYMGPVPAFFYAAGQLMDYAVHSWDLREGAGRCHAMSGEAADLLVPFMFVLWQSTIKADADTTSPLEIGVRVYGGHNAGDTRIRVSAEGMTYEAGSADDLPCVLEFDAAGLVLTAFGRINGGTVRGDQAIADRFLNLFYRI